jgi:nucleoid-associated protein YgaU
MALTDKYQPLINLAKQMGADNLVIQDNGTSLSIEGTVPTEADKQRLWEEYNRIDPDMRSGDLVLNVQAGRAGGFEGEEEYTVKSGDTLSEIAQRYEGISWRQIWEANRDQINDPDLIHPGQKLRIPKRTA